MRAADDEHAFASHEKFLQQFRQRAVAKLVFQHRFHFRIAAGHGVADDDEVRFVREILLRIGWHHLDFPLREERGHGRIHVRVGAGDREAFLLHRGGGRRHGRAANADKMNGTNLIGKHRRESLSRAPTRQEKVRAQKRFPVKRLNCSGWANLPVSLPRTYGSYLQNPRR